LANKRNNLFLFVALFFLLVSSCCTSSKKKEAVLEPGERYAIRWRLVERPLDAHLAGDGAFPPNASTLFWIPVSEDRPQACRHGIELEKMGQGSHPSGEAVLIRGRLTGAGKLPHEIVLSLQPEKAKLLSWEGAVPKEGAPPGHFRIISNQDFGFWITSPEAGRIRAELRILSESLPSDEQQAVLAGTGY